MNFTVKNLCAALVAAAAFLASAEGTDDHGTVNAARKYNNAPSLIAVLCQGFVDDADEKSVADFGLGILNGADGLFGCAPDDYSEEPPPNPMYPEPMEKDALYFGGTDWGRFIPETLVLNDGVRPDVSVITQNGLADGEYLASVRERFGGKYPVSVSKVDIPTDRESHDAFREFVEGVQSGKIDARNALEFKDGMVVVTGSLAVMKLNEILAKKIFDKNKGKCAMYVEQSYPLEWMYDYMTPHGFVMKLNAEKPDMVSDADVRENAEFWDWMTKQLLSNPQFARRRAESWRKGADGKPDPDHRMGVRAFSKLRLSHAQLYNHVKNRSAFATAIRQSRAIDPQSWESGCYYSAFLEANGLGDARDDYRSYLEKLGARTDMWR